MNPIYLGFVVALAVYVAAEPELPGGSNFGFGGNGAFGSSGFGSQQRSLPYGAGTPFGPNGGGRFGRSQGGFGNYNGFGGQGQFQQQRGSPYGAGNFGGFGGRSPRSPAGFDGQGGFGGFGGFGGSSYSNGIGQSQQRGLPYGAGTFGGNFQGFGGRVARSPAGFDGQGGIGGFGGFGGSSYSNGQVQPQQRGLPYGAGTFADPSFNGFQG